MRAAKRLLIVDDESGIRKLLSLYFTAAGFTVRTAGNGVEALTLASEQPFDLVLSDVRMPGINGYELIEQMRAENPHVTSLLMSGFDDVAPAARCGANAGVALRKPFRPSEALAAVERALAT